MQGKTKKIIEVKERVSTMDEIIEKIKANKTLTLLEHNDLKSYTAKLSRHGDPKYESVYKLYKKARANTDANGYAEKTYIAVHLNGSFIESHDRDELVNLMIGSRIAEDNYNERNSKETDL